MLGSISGKLAESACQSGLINQTDKEIYRFGFEAALLKFLHITVTLLIGAVFGMPLEAAAFLAVYSSLRIYAGGFHAKSRSRCFFISCAMAAEVLLIVKHCSSGISTRFAVPAALAAMGIILFLSPVAAQNKPLDQIEIQHYKKRVQIILCLHLLLLAIFLFAKLHHYLLIVCLSEVNLATMLVIGKFQLTVKSKGR